MMFINYQEEQKKTPSPKRASWRNKKVVEEEPKKPKRYDLDLQEGKVFDLDIGGDIEISEEDAG